MFIPVLYGENTGFLSKDEEDCLGEVSVVSASLKNLGFTPLNTTFSLDILKIKKCLNKYCPPFVFNLIESLEGKGSLIHIGPFILDYLSIPYTGCSKDSIFLTSNKLLAKKLLFSCGIETPSYHTAKDIINGNILFPPPYIIKSIWEHASIGIDESSIINSKKDLQKEMKKRCFYGRNDFFAEAYIEGREFNIALLANKYEPQVLPPAEISFDCFPSGKARIVDYSAKWVEDSFEYNNTNRKFDFHPGDNPLLSILSDISLKCWKLFNLNGYARVDFRVDEKGIPLVLEVNTNPCLSPESGFVAAANEAGLKFDSIIKRIVEDLLRNYGNRFSLKVYNEIVERMNMI